MFYDKSKCKKFSNLNITAKSASQRKCSPQLCCLFHPSERLFHPSESISFSLKYTKTLKIQLKPFTLAFFPGRCNGLIFLYFDWFILIKQGH